MFNTTQGYSLSDIAAVTDGRNTDDGMFGGNNGWWIILLFLFALNGGWGNGFGGNGAQGGALRSEIAYGFDMNGIENGIRGIQQGLCDGFYAMNTGMLNGFAGVQSALCQGFSGVTAGATQNTNDLMQAVNSSTSSITSQLSNMAAQNAACCCETQRAIERGFCDTNYNLATQACETRRAISDSTRDIIDSQNCGTRAILDFLTQDKIASLQSENQALKFAASQANQNAFITANQTAQTAEIIRRLETPCPVPAYVVPNPNCCYDNYGYGRYGYGYGFNSGCGCGCN